VVLVIDLGSKTAISWDVFKHEFNQHFFPESCRRQMHKFFDLVQGGMSVIEYAVKFL
jgi:hypothetical protein